jgi:hypothetical protein
MNPDDVTGGSEPLLQCDGGNRLGSLQARPGANPVCVLSSKPSSVPGSELAHLDVHHHMMPSNTEPPHTTSHDVFIYRNDQSPFDSGLYLAVETRYHPASYTRKHTSRAEYVGEASGIHYAKCPYRVKRDNDIGMGRGRRWYLCMSAL